MRKLQMVAAAIETVSAAVGDLQRPQVELPPPLLSLRLMLQLTWPSPPPARSDCGRSCHRRCDRCYFASAASDQLTARGGRLARRRAHWQLGAPQQRFWPWRRRVEDELGLQLRRLTVGWRRLRLHSKGWRMDGREPLPPLQQPLPLHSPAAAVSALRADGADLLVSTARCPSAGAGADGATFCVVGD